MKFEKFTVTLSLSVEQVNQLAGLTRLYNDRMVSEGYNGGYTELSYLELLLSFGLGGLLSDTLDRERNLKNKRDLKDSARNPSPEATPDEAAPDKAEPEAVPNAEEEAPGDRESEPDGEEDFLTLAPLPCFYLHDPTVQDTPYDPARYEGDAYECGGCVVENPETLAFVDALTEALCR